MAVHWCAEMDEVLRKEWPTNSSRPDVAKKIGVSLNTARKRAKELGIYRRKGGAARPLALCDYPKIPREQRFAQMLADGMCIRRDWKEMGFGSQHSANSSLQRLRQKLGWQAV